MRSDTAAGRMRLVLTLAVVSAAAVMLGLVLVVMSTAAHVVSRRPAGHVTILGLALGAAGIAVGLVALVIAVTCAAASAGGRRGSGRAAADRGHPAGPRHRAAASPERGRYRARSGATERGPGQSARDSRPRRDQVVNPTTVYSPRDVLDVSRDARAPGPAGPPGAAPPPRSAGPPRTAPARGSYGTGPPGSQGARDEFGSPRASRSGRSDDQAPVGRMGAPPSWPHHQPGAYPASPGREPPPAQPARPPQRPQQPMGSRAAPPPRDEPRRAAPVPPRAAAPVPPRAAAPVPPRAAFRPGPPGPSGRGQGTAGGRTPGGPGYAPPAGRRPAPSGTPAAGSPPPPGPPGPHGTFDGGYAPVIRVTDSPAPADADVFVYRDTSGQPDRPAAGSAPRDPSELDTAYWYDLLAENAAPKREETRGPFEPMVPSGGTPAGPGAAPAGTEPTGTGPGHGDAGPDAAAQAQARKLEQLKDLYLTAEAIGEENVGKHFDQLLAQQHELISEYFRQSAAARPAGPRPGESGPAVASPRDGLAADTSAAAEQPHAW